MELHSINCCLSTNFKLNTNIIFFELPMKINKDNANTYSCYEKYSK